MRRVSKSPALRARIVEAYFTYKIDDTPQEKANIKKLFELADNIHLTQHKIAICLGYENFGELIAEQIGISTEEMERNLESFLGQLYALVQTDIKEVEAFAKKQDGPETEITHENYFYYKGQMASTESSKENVVNHYPLVPTVKKLLNRNLNAHGISASHKETIELASRKIYRFEIYEGENCMGIIDIEQTSQRATTRLIRSKVASTKKGLHIHLLIRATHMQSEHYFTADQLGAIAHELGHATPAILSEANIASVAKDQQLTEMDEAETVSVTHELALLLNPKALSEISSIHKERVISETSLKAITRTTVKSLISRLFTNTIRGLNSLQNHTQFDAEKTQEQRIQAAQERWNELIKRFALKKDVPQEQFMILATWEDHQERLSGSYFRYMIGFLTAMNILQYCFNEDGSFNEDGWQEVGEKVWKKRGIQTLRESCHTLGIDLFNAENAISFINKMLQ